MKIFPVSLMSNQFCKMCGTCVHNCPYNSVHLDLRWPGSEIWRNTEPNPVTSLSILALLGILYPLFLHEGIRFHVTAPWPFTLLSLGCILGSVALFMAASLTEGRQGFKGQMRSYGYTYLPLAFAGHLAFQLPYLFSGITWLAAHSLSAGFHRHLGAPWPQRMVILGGIVWSWWTVMQLSGKRPLVVSLTHGALVLICGIALVLVLNG